MAAFYFDDFFTARDAQIAVNLMIPSGAMHPQLIGQEAGPDLCFRCAEPTRAASRLLAAEPSLALGYPNGLRPSHSDAVRRELKPHRWLIGDAVPSERTTSVEPPVSIDEAKAADRRTPGNLEQHRGRKNIVGSIERSQMHLRPLIAGGFHLYAAKPIRVRMSNEESGVKVLGVTALPPTYHCKAQEGAEGTRRVCKLNRAGRSNRPSLISRSANDHLLNLSSLQKAGAPCPVFLHAPERSQTQVRRFETTRASQHRRPGGDSDNSLKRCDFARRDSNLRVESRCRTRPA